MKTQKNLTTSQKLDYLIEEVSELTTEVSEIKSEVSSLTTEVSEIKSDIKDIKKEVKSHTQLLQDIATNAVTLAENQALEARVTILEHS